MRKTIFIDRDGVINRDPGGWTEHSYVTKWDDFFFIDGSLEALRKLKNAGYRVCVISNQAGISRGYFTHDDLDNVSKSMLKEIEKEGGKVDELYYCPHHDSDNCNCRKPKTGMIEKALSKADIDLENTYIIGDSLRDIEAGKRMGMKTVLVLSGKTPLSTTRQWNVRPDAIKNNLLETVDWILKNERNADEK